MFTETEGVLMGKILKWIINTWLYIYSVVMLLLFSGYAYLDLLKYSANKLVDGEMISAADAASLQHRMNWVLGIEGMFMIIFIVGLVICIYTKLIKQFIITNLILFISIVAIACILYLITPSPIGNLLQPMFVPTLIAVVVIICIAFINGKKKFRSNN
jgi:peptidoglycan/LPS O-acetylase OafA/YrhL